MCKNSVKNTEVVEITENKSSWDVFLLCKKNPTEKVGFYRLKYDLSGFLCSFLAFFLLWLVKNNVSFS